MAELADAQASGACGSNIVWVQVPSPASKKESFSDSFFHYQYKYFCSKSSTLSGLSNR